MSVVLSTSKKVITVLTSDQVPKKIEHERGVNLLFKLFLPFLDDYLYEESNYAEQITKKYIDEWVSEKKNCLISQVLYIYINKNNLLVDKSFCSAYRCISALNKPIS